MKKSVVKKDITKEVMKQIEELGNQRVLVGIPAAKTARNDTSKSNNAVIGYVMEFGGHIPHPGGTKYITNAVINGKFVGTRFVSNDFKGKTKKTKAHYIDIPARPFLIPGIKQSLEKVEKVMMQTLKATFKNPDKKDYFIKLGLNKAGMLASGEVKKYMTHGSFEPLAKSTIAARLRRGRTSEKPLIDTSQLRNAVTYVLRKK